MLVAVVLAGGWVASGLVIQRFTGFDLTQVPVRAAAFPLQTPDPSWRAYRTHGLTIRVPPALARRAKSSSAEEALILTNQRQTLWLSLAHQRVWWWRPRWYRWVLYSRRNPVGLMAKSLIVPPLGTRSPQLIDQQLGAWQAYLYTSPRRVVAECFDGPHQVTVVVVARRDGLLDLEEVRAMLASVHVGR